MSDEVDLRKYRPVFTPAKLIELKEIIAKSTPVVNWYDHGYEDGTIRGPFNRWFKCSEVSPEYRDNVSDIANDVAFACAAMQNFLPLIKEIQLNLDKEHKLGLEIESLQAKLNLAKECVKWYANGNGADNDDIEFMYASDDVPFEGEQYGKKARDYLKTITQSE